MEVDIYLVIILLYMELSYLIKRQISLSKFIPPLNGNLYLARQMMDLQIAVFWLVPKSVICNTVLYLKLYQGVIHILRFHSQIFDHLPTT